ncbi:hypothetical protein VNO78_25392 [Psophocarpus tetragonolobus]|uniref:Uncharacterized protein n=1 Tax=Psophocarpus tetragonolobus TaxID=3891 RepID=A0AAN9SA16_PSOTE
MRDHLGTDTNRPKGTNEKVDDSEAQSTDLTVIDQMKGNREVVTKDPSKEKAISLWYMASRGHGQSTSGGVGGGKGPNSGDARKSSENDNLDKVEGEKGKLEEELKKMKDAEKTMGDQI